MAVAFVGRIEEHFEKVTDPRVNRGTNYPLIEMVFVALCGAGWVATREDKSGMAKPPTPPACSGFRRRPAV